MKILMALAGVLLAVSGVAGMYMRNAAGEQVLVDLCFMLIAEEES